MIDVLVYDGLVFVGLIDGKGEDVWVGCGCVGVYGEEVLWLFFGVWVYVCFRVFRDRPFSVGERVGNWFISRVRARIERIFGYVVRFVVGVFCWVYGFGCVCCEVVCMILVYSLWWFVFFVG
ncbi:MAG: hypothetical protein FWH37_08790 [Candidatus Bathyarchaeota archaeon]|nr:hypothetical protein [Candidatus Termiticorpusculum sp.]